MQKEMQKVLKEMEEVLDYSQLAMLQQSMIKNFSPQKALYQFSSNEDYMELFLKSKKLEGCSDQTIYYYRRTIKHFLEEIDVSVIQLSAEEIRDYLSNYQTVHGCSRISLDNIRRNLSSFFSWLENEDFILKSPFKKIHKVKSAKVMKEAISDEDIELIRDLCCDNLRDIAMIDLLLSTGIRVGELVNLDIADINFEERECIVFGKGDKERRVYFDYKTKVHLQDYVESRTDSNPALFVTFVYPYNRLSIGAVEARIRKFGKDLNIKKIHPHRFRTTLATKAIQKGMPIEQVQRILGHNQIDTTLRYALLNDEIVKQAHRKLLG